MKSSGNKYFCDNACIDYQIATPGIAAQARAASVYKAQRFSDHTPLSVEYEWGLTAPGRG